MLTNSCRNDVKYLKNLRSNEKRSFLNSFDRVFCDCDGVLWKNMCEAIPGSAEGINFLRKCDKQVIFVTNNSITAIKHQIQKFKLYNVAAEKNEFIHPAQTICDHLREIQFEGLVYCIASSPFKALLREAGFQLVQEEDRIFPERREELHAAIYRKEPVKAVIIDVDFNLTAVKLMRAHVHLKDPDCLFIGGAADTLIPFGEGEIIGPGPFIAVVENSTKRKATILGKPGRHLCEHLKRRFALDDAKRTLFIGDSLGSDVKFGKMCGFQTLVVLSGCTKPQDLTDHPNKEELPDYALDSLGDLVHLLKE